MSHLAQENLFFSLTCLQKVFTSIGECISGTPCSESLSQVPSHSSQSTRQNCSAGWLSCVYRGHESISDTIQSKDNWPNKHRRNWDMCGLLLSLAIQVVIAQCETNLASQEKLAAAISLPWCSSQFLFLRGGGLLKSMLHDHSGFYTAWGVSTGTA